MDNLAHTLNHPLRNYHDLQQVAIKGVYGKKAGQLKPFDNLLVGELRQELQARGENGTDKLKKPQLLDALESTLKGVQRVPPLLFHNPTQSLTSLNFQDYSVLDSEPVSHAQCKGSLRSTS